MLEICHVFSRLGKTLTLGITVMLAFSLRLIYVRSFTLCMITSIDTCTLNMFWWPWSDVKVTATTTKLNWKLHLLFLTKSDPVEFKLCIVVTWMTMTMNIVFWATLFVFNFSLREIVDAFPTSAKTVSVGVVSVVV